LESVQRWLVYLRRTFPVLPFSNSSTHSTLPSKKLSLLLHNTLKSRSAALKHTLSVGVIGFPNTGKSSIINALTRRLGHSEKVVVSGAEAGLTKLSQSVRLDGSISLIDSPGIVFPHTGEGEEVRLVLLNVLPSTAVLDPRPAVTEILARMARRESGLEELAAVYGVPGMVVSEYVDSTTEFLVQVARKRGRLGRGGIPLLESAGRIVLNDWCAGRLHWWSDPPAGETHLEDVKAVVAEFAAEFSIENLLCDTDTLMRDVA
jgi:nuclear GTP-binding protein